MISWELVWLMIFLSAAGGLSIILLLVLSAYFQKIHQTKKFLLMLYLAIGFTLSLFMTFVSLVMTSRNEFCSNCHEMKPYTKAFEKSVHSQMSCLGCHGGQGFRNFTLHKFTSVKEPYLHLTNSYDRPINGSSELSKEMDDSICERCHDLNQRKVTARKDLIIDHKKHKKNGIPCTTCHNRVAHPNVESYEGEPKKGRLPNNLKSVAGFEEQEFYPDRMKMRYCMRCHTGEKGKKKGPNECVVCHPKKYIKPPKNHQVAGFLPDKSSGAAQAAQANYHGDKGKKKALHAQMALYDIKYCESCHEKQKLCIDCHKAPIPHPNNWKKTHGEIGKTGPEKCTLCHGTLNFCDVCHHKYDPTKVKWLSEVKGESYHPTVVREKGAEYCFECHNPTFCARCHVRGKPY